MEYKVLGFQDAMQVAQLISPFIESEMGGDEIIVVMVSSMLEKMPPHLILKLLYLTVGGEALTLSSSDLLDKVIGIFEVNRIPLLIHTYRDLAGTNASK